MVLETRARSGCVVSGISSNRTCTVPELNLVNVTLPCDPDQANILEWHPVVEVREMAPVD